MHDFFGGAGGDELAAVATSARADVDDIVGRTHSVFVMLDDKNGVFKVAKMFEGGDEFVVVALVKADRRLIENIEDALKAGADLGGKTDTLGFATGEGVGRTRKFEIAETDILHEFYTFADFFKDGVGDKVLFGSEFEVLAEDFNSRVNIERTHVDDIKVIDGDGEDGGFETGAVTGLALADTHETFDVFFNKFGSVGIVPATFKIRYDTFIGGFVDGAGGKFAVAGNGDFVFVGAGAVEDFFDGGVGEVANRGVDREVVAFANDGETLEPIRIVRNAVKRADAAFGDGEIRVQNESGVDFHADAKTGTGWTGTFGSVKREKAWREVGDRLVGVELTGVALRKSEDFGVFDAFAFDGGGVVGDFEEFNDSLP